MNTGFYARRGLVMGMLTMACIQPAMAADVKGTVFEETITLGGKELKLNGAGMRTKSLFSIYAMGLYLSEKKTSPEDVQSVAGPKRVKLVYQRELNSDEFGQLFISAMNNNSTKEQKAALINQTVQFGEIFANQGKVSKGDYTTMDWIPGTGTVTSFNGKKIGETLAGIEFYNAVMRIWLGEKPADTTLKAQLLGSK